MKLTQRLAVLLALSLPLGVVVAQEKSAPKKATMKAAVQTKTTGYKVDPAQSSIKWVGKKVTGQHNGTIAIKEGDVRVSNGEVVGGNFVIDTASLTVEDLEGDSKQKLTGHLKSDDFFGVEKNPTSTFEITNVEKMAGKEGATHTVTGNLTIKGKTNSLSFPATIDVKDNKLTAEAKNVEVDRTLYDIRYGSGKFFQNLGDKTIYDDFMLDISLVAMK